MKVQSLNYIKNLTHPHGLVKLGVDFVHLKDYVPNYEAMVQSLMMAVQEACQ